MIHRILVPLDPSPYADAAIKYACEIAKKHKAEITGMVILDIPGIKKSIGPVPRGALYYAKRLEEFKKQEAQERIENLLKTFKKTCEQAGVSHKGAEHQGCPSDEILEASNFYDLIITGLKTHFHFETREKAGDSLAEVLDHAITPVLAAPPEYRPFKKVLIAYDGSIAASRTLHYFVHFANAYQFEITLLNSNNDKETGQYYLEKAKEYLTINGLTNIGTEWTSQNIIRAFEDKYGSWADLVVAGIHAKKGILDFMVGSFSRHLIQAGNKPLFLGQ